MDNNLLPDFDDMVKLADRIGALMLQKLLVDIEIKSKEIEIIKLVSTDKKYFVNGKTPSMTYIKDTYKYGGIDGELLPMRQDLAKLSSELDKSRLHFSIMRDRVDVYRTKSANERIASL